MKNLKRTTKVNYKKSEKGITLIALIITIIILVILAAISIRAVVNMRIVGHAINGTQDYARQAKAENQMLGETTNTIDSTLARINEIQGENGESSGNNSGTGADVTQGIVIEDNDIQTDGKGNQRGNQYVWIPVGTIYTDTAMTTANAKTIIAGRYEFSDGTSSSYVNESGTTVTNLAKGTPI